MEIGRNLRITIINVMYILGIIFTVCYTGNVECISALLALVIIDMVLLA